MCRRRVDGGRGVEGGKGDETGWEEAAGAGVEGTGGRKAEGRRTVISGRRPCSQTRTEDRALDGGPCWKGSGTVGWTVQWLSGWEMGTKCGCGPPKLSRNQDDGLLLLPPIPPLPSPQVGSGPGWDGIGCPQALAPSRNPFVSERKRRQQCL